MSETALRNGIVLVLVIHLAIALWHDDAHGELGVGLVLWQNLFAYGVIVGAPIIGTALLWTTWRQTGLALYVLGMVGAAIFGVVHHYVLISPDNIAHLPDGTPESTAQFIQSAGALALVELAGAVFAAYVWGRFRTGKD